GEEDPARHARGAGGLQGSDHRTGEPGGVRPDRPRVLALRGGVALIAGIGLLPVLTGLLTLLPATLAGSGPPASLPLALLVGGWGVGIAHDRLLVLLHDQVHRTVTDELTVVQVDAPGAKAQQVLGRVRDQEQRAPVV